MIPLVGIERITLQGFEEKRPLLPCIQRLQTGAEAGSTLRQNVVEGFVEENFPRMYAEMQRVEVEVLVGFPSHRERYARRFPNSF
jgi:hypothetical protein